MRKYILVFLISLQITNNLLQQVQAAATVSRNIYDHTLVNCTKENILNNGSNVASITELNVNACNIKNLEDGFFKYFTSLKLLQLNGSKLNILASNALQGMKHLKILTLTHNNISAVTTWSEENMNALTTLNLRHNTIRQLTNESFVRYPNLQHLNLAANQLENIDSAAFHCLPHLQHLNLGHNHLKAINAADFEGMHRLTHLALHYNEISHIEATAFETNTNLRTLHLEGNKLNDLQFMNAKILLHLTHLNLSHNVLTSTLENLTSSSGAQLSILDLSYNNLTRLENVSFSGLEMLEQLNISHNHLQHIAPNSFHALTNLQRIDLSVNNLTHLPASLFNATTLLEHINLSSNALLEMSAALFMNMPFLHVIDLSMNQLSAIDGCIQNLATELNRAELLLDLRHNRFSTLNMTALLALERVELAENLWECNWLIQQMLRKPQSIHFAQQLTLATEWSGAALLLPNVSSINCYDSVGKRSIILLDTTGNWQYQQQKQQLEQELQQQHTVTTATNDCTSTDVINPSAPPLLWPRVGVGKFDSRSVIIWMLVALGITFSALRVARKLLERREQKHYSQQKHLNRGDETEVEERNLNNSE